MDNQELLNQIVQLFEEQTESLTKMMDEKIRESETRINLKIENDVTKRIDALFDGYKLTHEKQWELERSTEELKRQVEDLQSRIAAIKNRIS